MIITTPTKPPVKTGYSLPKTDIIVKIITLGFIWDFLGI